jgi:hypothetical protein
MNYRVTVKPKPKDDDLASVFSRQTVEPQVHEPVTVGELADRLVADYPEAVAKVPDDVRDCVVTSGPSPVRNDTPNAGNMQCWTWR